ncbi:MAG: hypothetical protein K8S21_09410, partial [Gemmatimonadetes bacterium]|nr:hypothetical protein [Gemmatimonadota bacterium]
MAGVLSPVRLTGQASDWSSALLMSPTPSPYLADWERVPSTAILTVTYTGTGAPAFRVRVSLNSTERGLVGTTESPSIPLAGGPSSFIYNVRDVVFDWTTVSRNPSLTDGAIKTGQIPEGSYRACARVFVGTATTPVTEACADFSILQPDPPQLLAPSDDQVVVSTQPFFQWTPVLAPPSIPVEYELTVVELIGKQVPRVALDANIPVLRQRSPTPFLIYPIDALPLERTKRYAWRVRAVDDAGRQLFRDGAQSEIRSFEMSDDLLKPVGRIADLPDEITLLPGVARLTGVRDARITRTETEVELDGTFQLEFLGAPGIRAQPVKGTRLRAGFRGDALTLLSGRVRAEIPEALIPVELRPFLTFSPMEFAPTTGFTATATLTLPGAAAVPLAGTVQLTANGLSGRLEYVAAAGARISSIGRAPVQFAARTARVTLPVGRLELGGSVQLFEQDVGCATSGPLESGVVRLAVFCEPARGLRPDPASQKSLITFGTLSGALAADLLTDTLGTALRAPAVFSVLGEGDRTCAVEFTMVLERGSLTREDEQGRCEEAEASRDLGWLRMRLSRLRLERMEYAPGGTFAWRALVDMRPLLRGAEGLQLPTIVDARLEETGIVLPAIRSDDPRASTSGYQELARIGVQPRAMGFKGGTFAWGAWLEGRDPGLEWGSGASAISFPNIPNDVSLCVNGAATEVDTLTIRGGVLEAQLTERRWQNGCALRPVNNFRISLRTLGGRVAVALDAEPRLTTLPTVGGGAVHPLPDCGIPVIGCVQALNFEPLRGDVRMTPDGRLVGVVTGYKPYWSEFDLKVAKLALAGGALTLAVAEDGAQTAVYDGDVTIKFNRIVEEKKESETSDADPRAAERTAAESAREAAAAAAAKSASSMTGAGAPVTRARIDVIAPRLLDGKFDLNGPFELSIGFARFVIAKATLDVNGLSIDGRQRALVSRVAATAKAGSTRTPPDSNYTTSTDTIGATFASVLIDPGTGDLSAGTITFDGRLALESSPSSTVVGIGGAAVDGAVDGGAQGALTATQRQAASTNVFGFSLANSEGSFDPTGMFGNIRLTLPSTLTMDAQGMRISGVAPARAAFGGTQYAGASVSFENGFAMRPAQGRVTAGRALLKVNDLPVAYLDASGWQVALGELVATVIPDTLFLPDQWSAYVVLRDAQKRLLVDVTETTDGPRIRTRPGTPVRLVVPALKGSRTEAPQATVAMDLTLARGTWRPVVGEIVASSAGLAADDFSTPEIPFQLDSITFRVARGAAPDLSAHGRLDLWQGA